MSLHRKALFLLATIAALLLVAGPAFAHVTVRADNPAPEAYAKYTVRVPNESEKAATTKIELELPEGYDESRYQPVEGWDIEFGDGVMTIEGGRIEPGQFQEFSFSAQNPAEAGDLTFPAIQTYEDGEVARWVGEPDSEKPAPVVAIVGEAGGHGSTAATEDPAEAASESAASPASSSTGPSPLTTVALIAGLLGLALGGAAFARSGRAR